MLNFEHVFISDHCFLWYHYAKHRPNNIKTEIESKEVRIKSCTCYYFHDIIRIVYFVVDNISMDEKSFGNILIHEFLYKNLIVTKPLLIITDKLNRFITAYDGSKHFLLLGSDKCYAFFNSFRYFIGSEFLKTYVDSFNYAKIKTDLDNHLPLKKALTCIMLSYAMSQFLMKIIISITIKRF